MPPKQQRITHPPGHPSTVDEHSAPPPPPSTVPSIVQKAQKRSARPYDFEEFDQFEPDYTETDDNGGSHVGFGPNTPTLDESSGSGAGGGADIRVRSAVTYQLDKAPIRTQAPGGVATVRDPLTLDQFLAPTGVRSRPHQSDGHTRSDHRSGGSGGEDRGKHKPHKSKATHREPTPGSNRRKRKKDAQKSHKGEYYGRSSSSDGSGWR